MHCIVGGGWINKNCSATRQNLSMKASWCQVKTRSGGRVIEALRRVGFDARISGGELGVHYGCFHDLKALCGAIGEGQQNDWISAGT
jgi:hypothetical protein